MYEALEGSVIQVAVKMADTGNPSLVPALIDILRFPLIPEANLAIFYSLTTLAGESEDPDRPELLTWRFWVEWLGKHTEVSPPDGYAVWKGRLLSIIDPRIGEFFYEGVKTRIRLEEIVWGGVLKDGIPDLTNPPVVSPEEATYLQPSDRVFGVSINGEHRAYPLRILNPHEMANDVVGGVPIALAY